MAQEVKGGGKKAKQNMSQGVNRCLGGISLNQLVMRRGALLLKGERGTVESDGFMMQGRSMLVTVSRSISHGKQLGSKTQV